MDVGKLDQAKGHWSSFHSETHIHTAISNNYPRTSPSHHSHTHRMECRREERGLGERMISAPRALPLCAIWLQTAGVDTHTPTHTHTHTQSLQSRLNLLIAVISSHWRLLYEPLSLPLPIKRANLPF